MNYSNNISMLCSKASTVESSYFKDFFGVVGTHLTAINTIIEHLELLQSIDGLSAPNLPDRACRCSREMT